MSSGLAGAAVQAGIGVAGGLAASSLAGSPQTSSPLRLKAGGLGSTIKNGRLTVKSNKAREGLISGISDLFRSQANTYGNIRGLVSPGFGALTKARVGTLENRGASRLSNLRDNLAKRRVLGSSFGQGQIQSEQRQLDQDIAEVRARSMLEELDLTTGLIEKQYTSDIAAVETILGELNLQAQFGQSLLTGAQTVLANNASIQSQLAVQNAQGFGAFLEPYVSSFGDAASGAVEGYING
jgi:hypothetical protein